MKKVIKKLFGTTKRAVISLLCMVIVLAGFGAVAYAVSSRDTNNDGTGITQEEAREVALSDAGLTTDTVTFTEERIDYENGVKVYEFEFYAENVEYDYEINAETGVIYSKSKEIYDTVAESSAAQPEVETATSEVQLEAETATSAAATEAGTNVNFGTVTLEDAKSIVLADAGVAAENATFTKAKQKMSHGEEIYDLEFYTDTYEYEYEVLVTDGSIVEKDMDARKTTATTVAQETATTAETSATANSYISVDEAKTIAVSAAGLSISDVIFDKAKLDKEDGIRVYEIEFYQGRTEYEYVINATTGEILEYDIDYDD